MNVFVILVLWSSIEKKNFMKLIINWKLLSYLVFLLYIYDYASFLRKGVNKNTPNSCRIVRKWGGGGETHCKLYKIQSKFIILQNCDFSKFTLICMNCNMHKKIVKRHLFLFLFVYIGLPLVGFIRKVSKSS